MVATVEVSSCVMAFAHALLEVEVFLRRALSFGVIGQCSIDDHHAIEEIAGPPCCGRPRPRPCDGFGR
jgi:imidazoleglycerol phosphate dehydratase HisB